MALTLAILKIGPLYLKYHYLEATVTFEWPEDRKSVIVTYIHSGVTCYQVKASPFKAEDLLLMRLEMLPIPAHTDEERESLKRKTIVTDFYNLLGVITRKTFQNNGDMTDTQQVVIRQF